MLPATASAGRLVATGHDVDDHCQRESRQCHFLAVSVGHARGGAPDPSAPVLGLDCNGDLAIALGKAGVPSGDRVMKCPSRPVDGFAADPLSTASYSAIVVGSSCGNPPAEHDPINGTIDCDSSGATLPDSDAIFARKADIEAFFNDGGGIVALAGGHNGDGDPSTGPDEYYSFLPVPVGGHQVFGPFALTPVGVALGLIDGPDPASSDINCCETHNSFNEPAPGGALDVVERDAIGSPETLLGAGVIVAGELTAPPSPPVAAGEGPPTPVAGESMVVDPVSGKVLVKLPGSSDYQSITEITGIPVGATVDATSGVAAITSAADQSGHTQTANFWDGAFTIQQKLSKNLVTDIVLAGGRLLRCPVAARRRIVFTGQNRGAEAFTSRKRRKRRLWGDGKGNFRTRGNDSAATVRGTKWLTSDGCNGTRTTVREGKVKVRDFAKNKTITVSTGQAYLARP